MDFCYFIINNVATTDKQDLPPGARIIKIPIDFTVMTFKDGDGPFFDINTLKKNSNIFKKLDNKRKQKILLESNFMSVSNLIFGPSGETFSADYINFFQHLTKGDLVKGVIKGYHLYDENRCRLVEIINQSENGVWEAIIDILDYKSNTWFRKEKSSTFFPRTWDLQKLFDELRFLMGNKILLETDVYESYTTCGIKVKLYFKNGVIKTLYPVI